MHRSIARTSTALLIGAAMVLACGSTIVRGDEPSTSPSIGAASAPTSAPVDPWPYNLFNPVPAGQLRDMETDRPSTTNSPHTIDAGHLQIESGFVEYGYNRDRYHGANSRTDTWNVGQTNFRVGVFANVEFNVVIDPYVFNHAEDRLAGISTRASGIGDITVGGKVNLFGNDSPNADATWHSAMAIQPQFKLPSIDDTIGNGFFECSFAVPFEINLPRGFHLDLQPTIAHVRNTSNTGDATTFQGAASLDHVIFGKLDVYLEYATAFSTESHTEPTQTLDFGGAYPLADNLQLDAGCFIGLNKATPTLDVTVGISVRF